MTCANGTICTQYRNYHIGCRYIWCTPSDEHEPYPCYYNSSFCTWKRTHSKKKNSLKLDNVILYIYIYIYIYFYFCSLLSRMALHWPCSYSSFPNTILFWFWAWVASDWHGRDSSSPGVFAGLHQEGKCSEGLTLLLPGMYLSIW